MALIPLKLGLGWRNSNLSCIMLWQIHLLNFKSISQKTAEKGPKTEFYQRAITAVKSGSSVTKIWTWSVLCHDKFTKFQVNISKDDWEKFGKNECGRTPIGLTDRQKDGEETYSPPGFTSRGLINVTCDNTCIKDIMALTPLTFLSSGHLVLSHFWTCICF